MKDAPVGFLLHPASPLHDTGWGHPEHQGRLRALASAVEKDLPALHGRVVQVEPSSAADVDLLRVHTEEHLDRVRAAAERARAESTRVRLDPDTVVSAESWDAACGSAGCGIAAALRTAAGELTGAFVAARPPGHHATPDRAMGFCLVNSVAVCARRLQAEGLAERVLILDWDVHHGNGTQDIFWSDPTVYFCSLHQSPHWPGTGKAEERGGGAGEGTTLNVPIAAGTPPDAYRRLFSEALERIDGEWQPDFVLISCGFDCLAGDPLGGLLLEPADLHWMTSEVKRRAAEWCSGRVVALLEGGYDPVRTGRGTTAVLRALAELPEAG